jgi:hypothetical protein
MQAEFAVVADRDDAAGALAVLLREDREAIDRPIDFVAPLLELRRFGGELVGETVFADVFELAEALFDALDLGGEFGGSIGWLWTNPRVLREEPVFGIEHSFGPRPLRAQFGGPGFELLDREAVHQSGIVEKAVFVAGEEIAGDRAAGGLIGLGADEHPEIGIERHRALGQQPLHRIGLDVGIGLELVPHRELGGMVGAEGEGGDGVEIDVAVAVGVEQFRRELTEAQALLDMPFGGAEAFRDRVDRGAAVDQGHHGDEFVGRMHGGPDGVFGEGDFDGVLRLPDFARDFVVGLDDAFGGEFLQDLEPPAAGIHLVGAFSVGEWRRVDDQVLQNAVSADAGFERSILGRRHGRLADVGGGQDKPTKLDVLDFGVGGHDGDTPCDGRAKAFSRPVKPVTKPLSALFL